METAKISNDRMIARMTAGTIPMKQLIVNVAHRDVDLDLPIGVKSVSSLDFNPATLSLKSVDLYFCEINFPFYCFLLKNFQNKIKQPKYW